MKFLFAFLLMLSLNSLSFAQKNEKTGRSDIDEEAFNTQLEKCKVDTNNSSSPDVKKTNTSHSSKANAQ